MKQGTTELVLSADASTGRAAGTRVAPLRHAPARRAQRGVSLIEVLIVITIAAVLLGIGVPNLQAYLATNRVVSASQEMYTALQYARSEAMRRGAQVTLRHGGTPGSRDWTSGWRMFVDVNGNGAEDAGDELLRAGVGQPTPVTVYANANFADFIAFDNNGRVTNAGGGTFVVCYGTALNDGPMSRSRAVLVNGAGRVRFAQDVNKDGVPEKDTGPVNSCTNP